MQEIRVLLYTDLHNPNDISKNMTLDPDPLKVPFGLSLMRDLILLHKDKAEDVKIDLINRNIINGNILSHAAQKITPQLLRCYDELWVFGQYQADVDVPMFDPVDGGPQNELGREEVETLREWMDKGGGVLITGDHMQEKPGKSDPKLKDFLNLGRALGHRIPRAGEMREWESSISTAIDDDSVNTQSPGLADFGSERLDDDAEPQHITLEPDRTKGEGESIEPHYLFSKGPGNRILVFPDHMHEGQLAFPKLNKDNEKIWPKAAGSPFVVAKGFDKRFCPPRVYKLVSVYDGDLAKIGRIVADTSWHHYLNVNLRSLRHNPSDPTAPLNQIGQYYVNLVRWLAPSRIRAKLDAARFYRFATHPLVLEVAGSSPQVLGETLKRVMQMESRSNELREMLQASIPQKLVGQENLFDFVPEEIRLGTLVEQYHKAISRVGIGAENKLVEKTESDVLVSNAFKQALEIYLSETGSRPESIDKALSQLP